MAIGTMTKHAAESAITGKAVFFDFVSFAGDGAYPTGGTTDFDATLQALVGDARDVMAVVGQDCGGYIVAYDRANGTLKVYQGDNANASPAPAVEVPNTTDLSGTTFNLLVISK